MQRRLFFAFGFAILASGGTFALVSWALGTSSPWREQVARVERFTAGRFDLVWDERAARRELTVAVARDLAVGVRLYDESGRTLESAGAWDDCHHVQEVRIPGRGRLDVCVDSHMPRRPWAFFVALLVSGAVLWAFAGRWSRRITRPLRELTDVARDLGEGRLDRRARLRHGQKGEVGELTGAINEMASRIQRQLEAERELLATVSHEMRTPLARIRVLVELGREGKDGKDVFAGVEREVIEMDALVGDLLAGARIDFGSLQLSEIAVDDVARRALDRAGLAPDALALVGSPGVVRADATLLARALSALLDNAVKHGAGLPTLRVARAADRVRFEVEDDGAGFPPGAATHAFEPFSKGQNSSGTGLGLAIVRRIAEAHRGRAWAKNREEGGAVVGFEIPA